MFHSMPLLTAASLALGASAGHGFMPPRRIAATRCQALSLTPPLDFETLPSSCLLLSNDFGGMYDPLVSSLRTLGLAVLGFAVFTFVLSVIVAVFVVPAAVKELEDNIMTQYPDLWDEYQGKLEEGETLGMRPDLMQELGSKMQKLQMAQFDKAAAEAMAEGNIEKDPSGRSGTVENDAIDVEITSKKIETKDTTDDDR
jgi:hypothetical protein